ncbi:hypothetical protein SAMN04488033_10281 [Salegentibacter agarivorans]|uniref:DUF4834 domain-containing protein n=1 Tax=Salegentibacter agarivorans TaxID=345907 RepID=A0A1I2KBP7_9FLAO|nr:DUF4834 family protein [Salegentibacter agarivorans]SFF62647.1 hypothetical protein SAMN04488033_10281 [Salegentibacter agarivorans]
MLEASFSNLLQTILIILLVYFAFKMLIKWFGPLILKYFLRKMGKRFEEQFRQQQGPASQKKEGKVSIDKKPKGKRNSNKNVGEYIDYEEID